MSSKRLVDFLILASTTKEILKQHIRLRTNQLSLYSQTSSLTKPLRERHIPQHAVSRHGVKAQAEAQLDAQKGARERVQRQVREEKEKEKEEEKKKDIPITKKPSVKVEEAGILDDPTAKVPTTSTATVTIVPPPADTEPKPPRIKDVDPNLFILRSARGSSSLLTRIRKQNEEAKEQVRENKQEHRPKELQPDVPLPAIPVDKPSIIVPEKPVTTAPAAQALSTKPALIQSLSPGEASTITTTPTLTSTHTSSERNLQRKDELETPIPETNAGSPPPPPPPPEPTIISSELEATIASLTSGNPTSEQSRLTQQAATSPSGHIMTASRVPSSRFSRMMHYTGLGIGMTFGALTEGIKRATIGGSSSEGNGAGSLMLNEANVERLVKKLSRMRGAALKLGQMLSFQDSKLLPPTLHQILSRVQDSADYMPASQLHPLLKRSLGSDWPSLFPEFNLTPIAAASIGQVHLATLRPDLIPAHDPLSPQHPNYDPNNTTPYKVAVKIQYPNIAQSISSDLNNLSLLLTASKLLPKGLYLDRTIANARTELAWECDYIREAEGITKFSQFLPPQPTPPRTPTPLSPAKWDLSQNNHPFTLPTVIPTATTPEILTMTFLPGTPITRIPDLTQPERDFIGSSILRLSLTEIAKWKCMQTDPNFSNFLWHRPTQRIQLIDFGAWRDFPPAFVETYLSLLRAGRRRDFAACRELSVQLGYLTGMESRTMVDAHVKSVFILAEPFIAGGDGGVYDYSRQTVTERVKELIPVMLRERLTPPPEETYSLHRKLSGAFLVCARLGSRVRCEEIFGEVVGF